MVANVDPIYSRTPDIQWGTTVLATANTAKDGTGTVLTVFTADATEGGWAGTLVARAAGTNIATVLRVFINNGSTNGTAANNILRYELTLPATTLSEVAQLAPYEIPLNLNLPAGYKINCTVGTTVAAGYYISVNGGKY
jgi:hypothetical protein